MRFTLFFSTPISCAHSTTACLPADQVTLLVEYKRDGLTECQRDSVLMPRLRVYLQHSHTEKYRRAFSKPASPADSTSSSLDDFSLLPKCILTVSSQEVLGMVSMCPFLFPFFLHIINPQLPHPLNLIHLA